MDRRISDRVLERTAAQGSLQTLTRAELQLDLLPCTTDPHPKAVRAWVRFGATPVQVDAEACMWTPRAVAIRFHVGTREYRCWVWANAVDPSP
ncbi:MULTISPECIES: hypothetical protein [unclassified Microbacterium]|uniref:hypothetical protein n=1 Tax=unclassified Microbacterium TaxID=2609290 RepID=UPI001F0B7B92|nr:hypothetical protein [Microbacterium sp. ABRD28]